MAAVGLLDPGRASTSVGLLVHMLCNVTECVSRSDGVVAGAGLLDSGSAGGSVGLPVHMLCYFFGRGSQKKGIEAFGSSISLSISSTGCQLSWYDGCCRSAGFWQCQCICVSSRGWSMMLGSTQGPSTASRSHPTRTLTKARVPQPIRCAKR